MGWERGGERIQWVEGELGDTREREGETIEGSRTTVHAESTLSSAQVLKVKLGAREPDL